MYNGEANILQENLNSFFTLAQRLKVSGLLQKDNTDSQTQGETKAEEIVEIEESFQYDSDKPLNTNKSFHNKKPMNSHPEQAIKTVSLTSGDQEEIDRKVDEHIETCSDGTLKCKFCGKVGKDLRDFRNHVETHLDGISYQCQFCDKTFRTRKSSMLHKSRKHK